MSDCSTHAFDVPLCERGVIDQPRRASLKELAALCGEPPWTLSLPWPDALPIESLDFVETVRVGGVAFRRCVP